jgi:hypothetical protein
MRAREGWIHEPITPKCTPVYTARWAACQLKCGCTRINRGRRIVVNTFTDPRWRAAELRGKLQWGECPAALRRAGDADAGTDPAT